MRRAVPPTGHPAPGTPRVGTVILVVLGAAGIVVGSLLAVTHAPVPGLVGVALGIVLLIAGIRMIRAGRDA